MYCMHVLSQRDEKVIQYLLCHHWEADILMGACAALGACLIYGLHGPFYSHNLIPPSSALSAPLEQEIFSPRTTRSHILRRRRHLVNISLQIHGQIPLWSGGAGIAAEDKQSHTSLLFHSYAGTPLLTPLSPHLPPAHPSHLI